MHRELLSPIKVFMAETIDLQEQAPDNPTYRQCLLEVRSPFSGSCLRWHPMRCNAAASLASLSLATPNVKEL